MWGAILTEPRSDGSSFKFSDRGHRRGAILIELVMTCTGPWGSLPDTSPSVEMQLIEQRNQLFHFELLSATELGSIIPDCFLFSLAFLSCTVWKYSGGDKPPCINF